VGKVLKYLPEIIYNRSQSESIKFIKLIELSLNNIACTIIAYQCLCDRRSIVDYALRRRAEKQIENSQPGQINQSIMDTLGSGLLGLVGIARRKVV
jgi:hypothetical protein